MKGRKRLLYLPLLVLVPLASPRAGGFTITPTPVPASAACVDILPDGTVFYFDGTAVRRIQGTTNTVVYTPTGKVFGSFIKVLPGGQALLFGESTGHTITEVGIGVLPYFRTLTTLKYNYDCAIGPGGEILVSAPAGGTFGTNAVYRVDRTGGTDLLIQVAGASGPVTVLPGGDLLLGLASAQWPVPPASASILRYPLARWRGALGPTHLTEKDGTPVVRGLDSVHDMAADGRGTLYISDAINNLLLASTGAGRTTLWTGGTMTPTNLALTHGPAGSCFGPFQPDRGGRLVVLTSDWVSTGNLLTVRPQRPALASTPAGVVPGRSRVTLAVSGGPESGTALLLYGLALTRPEPAFALPGTTCPLFLALTPSGLLPVVTPLQFDKQGAAGVSLLWPGGHPGSLHLQALVLGGGTLVGSTGPATLQLGR